MTSTLIPAVSLTRDLNMSSFQLRGDPNRNSSLELGPGPLIAITESLMVTLTPDGTDNRLFADARHYQTSQRSSPPTPSLRA